MILFLTRYGEIHPQFFIGSLDEAIHEALTGKAANVSCHLPYDWSGVVFTNMTSKVTHTCYRAFGNQDVVLNFS